VTFFANWWWNIWMFILFKITLLKISFEIKSHLKIYLLFYDGRRRIRTSSSKRSRTRRRRRRRRRKRRSRRSRICNSLHVLIDNLFDHQHTNYEFCRVYC
jgi:hypothetical protein